MLPGSLNNLTTSTGPGSTPKDSDCSNADFNMVCPSMPNICLDEAKATPAEMLLHQRPAPVTPVGRMARRGPNLGPLKVDIPVKRKVTVVELPNPYNREPISAKFQAPQDGSPVFLEKKVWERTKKALITAGHTAFTSKYSIKVQLHDAKSKVVGALETDMHHNPGHFCFFCIDYMPENFKVQKGMNVSKISPYCNCMKKTIKDHNPNDLESNTDMKLGEIKSSMCSNKTNLYDKNGELAYSLNNGNEFLRNWRFLVETPFLPLCIPYKIATYCCMDTFWRGKTKNMKLYDHKNAKEFDIGIVSNHGERANEWQEVIRNGEKINQYKGEEVFLCKEFEVNLPEGADEEQKKLIIGALIAELPSTVDRCSF